MHGTISKTRRYGMACSGLNLRDTLHAGHPSRVLLIPPATSLDPLLRVTTTPPLRKTTSSTKCSSSVIRPAGRRRRCMLQDHVPFDHITLDTAAVQQHRLYQGSLVVPEWTDEQALDGAAPCSHPSRALELSNAHHSTPTISKHSPT